MVYVPKKYPKWKFHPNGDSVMVQDQAEEMELGSEWVNSEVEAAVKSSEPVQADEPEEAEPQPEKKLHWKTREKLAREAALKNGDGS